MLNTKWYLSIMLRVLVAHNFYRTAGGEDRYVRVLEELLTGAKEIEAGALQYNSADMKPSEAAARMITQKGWSKRTLDQVKAFKPDVVHLNNPYPGIGLKGVRHLASCAPIVMTLHNYRLRCPNGYFLTRGQPCERCTRWGTVPAALFNCMGNRKQSATYALALGIERILGPIERWISLFLSPSEFLAKKMIELGLPSDRVRYTPYPYNGPFAKSSDPGDTIVFVGRLSEEKGAHLLVEAARMNGLPTLIVGDGPERIRLERAASANTTFTGWVSESEVFNLLSKARLVVIPSLWYENLPYVLISGMAAGRTVLVPDHGSLGDFVKVFGIGKTFNAGSARSLSETAESIWHEEHQLRRLGGTALDLAKSKFLPQDHLASLLDIYAEVST